MALVVTFTDINSSTGVVNMDGPARSLAKCVKVDGIECFGRSHAKHRSQSRLRSQTRTSPNTSPIFISLVLTFKISSLTN